MAKNFDGHHNNPKCILYQFKDSLAGGLGGVIVRTDDGGLTWNYQQQNSSIVSQIKMLTDSIAYACTASGQILRTTTGGQAIVGTSPTFDSLAVQIYPQPTSNTVVLAYSLPMLQHISISLYDVAGNLVSQAVTGSLQQEGQQSVTINTANLASGTYTFVLTSEQYQSSGMISVIH